MNVRSLRRGASARMLFWLAFALFVALAVIQHGDARALRIGPYGAAKLVVLGAWLAFLAYTAWCSAHESLFRSIGEIARLHWGRQIGIDLYIGFTLVVVLIGVTSGSFVVMLLWLVPIYAFGNLATLLYVLLEWESLVARFAG